MTHWEAGFRGSKQLPISSSSSWFPELIPVSDSIRTCRELRLSSGFREYDRILADVIFKMWTIWKRRKETSKHSILWKCSFLKIFSPAPREFRRDRLTMLKIKLGKKTPHDQSSRVCCPNFQSRYCYSKNKNVLGKWFQLIYFLWARANILSWRYKV